MPPRNLSDDGTAQAPCWHMFGFCLEKRRLTPLRLRSAAFLSRAARAHASCVAWIASSTPGLRCTSCTEAAARAQAASIIRVTHRSGDSRLSAPSRTARLSVRRYLRSAPWPLAALSAPLSSAGRADPFPAAIARLRQRGLFDRHLCDVLLRNHTRYTTRVIQSVTPCTGPTSGGGRCAACRPRSACSRTCTPRWRRCPSWRR